MPTRLHTRPGEVKEYIWEGNEVQYSLRGTEPLDRAQFLPMHTGQYVEEELMDSLGMVDGIVKERQEIGNFKVFDLRHSKERRKRN